MNTFQETIASLQTIQTRLLDAIVCKHKTLEDFFKAQGLPEIADKISEYGIPRAIYVPQSRMKELSRLSLICPVYGRTEFRGEENKTLLLSWVESPAMGVYRDKEVPLLKRISIVPIAVFEDNLKSQPSNH